MNRKSRVGGSVLGLGITTLLLTLGCAAPQKPAKVAEAEAMASSPSTQHAERLAPQATALARGLVEEAKELSQAGNEAEAAIVGEQAVAAFEEAFALSRAARATVAIEQAKKDVAEVEQRLAALHRAQERAEREAEAFELRARIALDQEAVLDVEALTRERARARRQAALQLSSEARLLCLAARLVGRKAPTLGETEAELDLLSQDLSTGSVRQDMYPRAAEARTRCLTELTLARRAATKPNPERAGSDRLFLDLTETVRVLAFRDDRGVVVVLRPKQSADGNWTESTTALITLLSRTSEQNPSFPLLVVGHSANKTDADSAEDLAKSFARALEEAGAREVTVASVGALQPLVDPRIREADSQNERLEVVFVAPAR